MVAEARFSLFSPRAGPPSQTGHETPLARWMIRWMIRWRALRKQHPAPLQAHGGTLGGLANPSTGSSLWWALERKFGHGPTAMSSAERPGPKTS